MTTITCRRLRQADSLVIVTGQGSYEAPDRSREFSTFSIQKAFRIGWMSGATTSITTGFGGERCCRIILGNCVTDIRLK